jgi:hypothetical protein
VAKDPTPALADTVGAFFMPDSAPAARWPRIPTREITMSTPEAAAAPAAEPAGEPSGDATAQNMLADAVSAGQFLNAKPAPPASAPASASDASGDAAKGGEQETDWEAESAKWKSLARKHEKNQLSALGFTSKDEIEQLRTAAAKYAEFQDAQKTEQQRLTEAKATAEQQLADLKSTNARLMAAASHAIPPDLIDLLGSGTDEEINARAELLAERLKAAAPAAAAPSGAAPQRPVESLTPGAAPASSGPVNADEWIRKMAGRTT